MPKRIGYRYELVESEENCIMAIREMLKGKKHHAKYGKIFTKDKAKIKSIIAKRIKRKERYNHAAYFRLHGEEIAKRMANDFKNGTWIHSPYRTKCIYDNLRGKQRNLKIPCLYDQCMHHAIMIQTVPDLLKRKYYYDCGSMPKAGQSRAVDALRRQMSKKKPFKYAMVGDVHHFYESCTKEAVMWRLRRLYKDKRFLHLHEIILDGMGGTLAIGFYPSPWYASLVLCALIDRPVKQEFARDGFYVRYADDFVLLLNAKRRLHKIRLAISENLARFGMKLKHTWQIFPTKSRAISFLSYRFFREYTLVRKVVMYRIARCAKRAAYGITPHVAMAMMSYKGILKRCDSFIFRRDYVYKYVTFKKCRKVIRYVTKLCRTLESAAALSSECVA